MPALPNVPDVIRISWRWTADADLDVVSRIYMEYAGTAPTNADMTTFAGASLAHMQGRFIGYWTSDVELVECVATDLSSPTAGTGSAAGTYAGTLAGAPTSANNCTLMNFLVNRRYRGGKPRVYLPFGNSTTLHDKQTWASTWIANMNSQWPAFISDLQSSPPGTATLSNQVNVSYYSGFTVFTTPSGRAKNISTLRTGGPHVDVIVGANCNPKVGSQRRRVAA